MGCERFCSKVNLAKTMSLSSILSLLLQLIATVNIEFTSKIILEAYPILATLCDVIDLTNQSFTEKIRVAGCRPSVPVG